MIDIDTQKEAVTKTAKNVVDHTVAYGNKAVEFSAGYANTAADKAKELFATTKTYANTGIDKVSSVKLGDKNVSEHAKTTVDSVQSAVDVDQITDQVAKLRHQIEGVVGSWKESFRPTTNTKAPAKKASATSVDYSELTVDELRKLAAKADISGRSKMNKGLLVAALQEASK